MLQFEFDIRNHKINNNDSKGIQLALGISFLICAALFYSYTRYFDFFPFSEYLILIFVILSLYFLGLLVGFKLLYPKEYLTINSRKLTYKTGWRNKKLKVYLKDIKEFSIQERNLILKLKSNEKLRIDLENFSDQAIIILKNYLNL